MRDNYVALSQIGITLAKHFDCVCYVDIDTNNYYAYVHMKSMDKLGIPESGNDYFVDFRHNAAKWIYRDDLDLVMSMHNKKDILENLSPEVLYQLLILMLLLICY